MCPLRLTPADETSAVASWPQVLDGLVGVKVIMHHVGRYFSPVYGNCEWTRGVQVATCAIGCARVPNDGHQGCGFHAYWETQDAKNLVRDIHGMEACLVLIECLGRVAMHERGLRAQQARIIAVLDWDPALIYGAQFEHREPAAVSVPLSAALAFEVPLVDDDTAAGVMADQRYRMMQRLEMVGRPELARP